MTSPEVAHLLYIQALIAWCRDVQDDLKHLRSLWEMVGVVMGKFSEWCATLWDKIDVDFLIEENKQLAKDVRTLNKAVRAFEVYKCALADSRPCICLSAQPWQACLLPCIYDHSLHLQPCSLQAVSNFAQARPQADSRLKLVPCRLLEGAIKSMLTTLPLVLDLHHPAMRPRHWAQLMKVPPDCSWRQLLPQQLYSQYATIFCYLPCSLGRLHARQSTSAVELCVCGP